MKAYEKEIEKLELHRALIAHDIEVMVCTCYNSFFLKKLEITFQSLNYNIGVYRSIKPLHLKQVSHLLLPLDETLF